MNDNITPISTLHQKCLFMKDSKLKRNTNELPIWKDDINLDDILNKYGPEGCYEIADALKKIADKDMEDALNESRSSNE